jgi:Nitroreductase family
VEAPAEAEAPRPALKTSLWGSRGGDLGCDQVAAQHAVLRKGGVRARDLDRILEAARRTSSVGNQQAWDFVVCTDPEQLTQLAKVWRSAGHAARSAATMALIAPADRPLTPIRRPNRRPFHEVVTAAAGSGRTPAVGNSRRQPIT